MMPLAEKLVGASLLAIARRRKSFASQLAPTLKYIIAGKLAPTEHV